MNTESDRAARFVKDLEKLKVKDTSAGKPVLWLRICSVAMITGVVLAVVAYFLSHRTTSADTHYDAVVLALGGVVLSVVSSAVYLRFALTNFLRFWLARQSFDLQMQTERLAGGTASAPSDPSQPSEASE
jgi:hypothetical protein